MSGRPLFAVWAAALAALAHASPAGATVMVEVPLEALVRDADAIVHGFVERTGTQMVVRDGGLEPRTITVVRVRTWLKGSGGETVVIREIGGEWQNGGMRIDGTPVYGAGDEVVAFLERNSEQPSIYRTYAMVQGKFDVVHGAPGVPSMVRRDLASIAFARWVDGEMTVQGAPNDPAMALEPFLDLVRRWSR